MLNLNDYERIVNGTIKPPAYLEKFRVDIPPQRVGAWEIKKVKVDMDLTNLRLMRDGRGCYPGEYTALIHDERGIVMSDTTAECCDNLSPYRAATGRCLIHGLGLGSLLKAILSKDNVTHIDIVEIDKDIIDMISPYYEDKRVFIHHGDCLNYKWPPNTKWDMVWHDIWDTICKDNLPEIHKLHRKFGKRSVWQSSWSIDEIRRLCT